MPLSSVVGAQSIIKPGVCTSSTRPAVPFEGQMIFETDTDRLYIWNGTVWVIPNAPAQNPQGMELIKAQTVGSGVTSVVVTGAFSANYENYEILWTGGTMTSSSSDAQLLLQLGSSTTGYTSFLQYTNGVSNLPATSSNTSFLWVGGGSTGSGLLQARLFCPFLAIHTRVESSSYNSWNNGYVGHMIGFHSASTSYSDFTIGMSGTGTMVGGTVRVYGYRNS
jgi:hypothetical protein